MFAVREAPESTPALYCGRVRRIVILTGAGISAESGLATFRDDDGLWAGHRVEDVATPEGFSCDPVLVQSFYDARRAELSQVAPNAAHLALARLEREFDGDVVLVTQNVDDLHERAGSRQVIHMHGELLSAWCTACDARHPWSMPLANDPPCPACGRRALRPDIVWFGEIPYQMEQIDDALRDCDLFVAIGTSAEVYPAAGFVQWATVHGAETLELNLTRTRGSALFASTRQGSASQAVPAWVAEVLAN